MVSRSVRFFFALLILALGLPVAASRADGHDGDGDAKSPVASISADEIKSHIDWLADDEREGRQAGTAGGRAAAEYIAKQFETYGIGPGAKGSYFQDFGDGRRNVVGVLPGSDPQLKDEVIVLGAHYDHVGKGTTSGNRGRMGSSDGDDIWNGADDNASGTSGVLEIAQAFSMLETPPKRTILFILFDAEEAGLIGSRHYTQNPLFPIDKTAAMVNLDMIGRGTGERTELYGSATGEGLAELVEACNEDVGLEYRINLQMMYNSDHAPFVQAKVPVLFFFTGLHSDYHRPSDHADKIAHEPAEKIARLSFLVVRSLADRDERFAFQAPPSPRQRPILGVRGETDAATGGYKITQIFDGRPASRAGLKSGDILLKIGDTDTKDRRGLLAALWKVEKDATVSAVIIRDGERMEVAIPFGPAQRKKAWY